MQVQEGKEYLLRLTTNELLATVVRPLTEEEVDPEVGPMYAVTIHVYGDELSPCKEEDYS